MGEVERAGAGNGDGGAPELRWLLGLRARTKEEPRKRKMGRGMDRAGTGGDNGRLWPVLAALDRALATRGRRSHHAARKLCFCRPLTSVGNGRFSWFSARETDLRRDLARHKLLIREELAYKI